jgi:PAS domain S-box-containing protein
LRALIVEDSSDDATLMVRHLLRAGFDVTCERVETSADLTAALARQTWDVVLSDYQLPHLNGLGALRLVQASGQDVPFIIVSGTIGEDLAVSAMKAGAHDYVMKGNLARLTAAIEREVKEADTRRARRQAEAALNGTERRFRALIEKSHEVVALLDRQGKILYESPSITSVLGYAPDELVGQSIFDYVWPEEVPALIRDLVRLSPQPGASLVVETRCRHKNGSWRQVETRATNLLFDPDVLAIVINFRDVTARRLAEVSLRRFQRAIEQLTDAVFMTDTQGRIQYVNPAFEKMYGYRADEALGRTPRIIKSGLKPRDYYPVLWTALLNKQVVTGEIINKAKDGRLVPVEGASLPVLDEHGNITSFLAVHRDITERKQAEAALRDSEAHYRAIVEDQTELICRSLPDGTLSFVNEAYCRYFDKRREDLIGQTCVAPILDEDRAYVEGQRAGLDLDHPVASYEHRVIAPGSRILWQKWIDRALFDENDRVIEYQSVGHDITERKQRENEREALIAIAADLRTARTRDDVLCVTVNQAMSLLQAGGAALMLHSPDNGRATITFAQGLWADLNGSHLPDNLIAFQHLRVAKAPFILNCLDPIPPHLRDKWFTGLSAVAAVPLIAEQQIIGTLWIGRAHEIMDSDVRLLVAIAAIAANALHRANVIETLEQRVADRTRELTEANQKLQELDRLKDEFVSNVSHELRTPLTSIMLQIDLLEHGKPGRHAAYMATLHREAIRLRSMIENLLDLSRLDRAMTPVQLLPTDVDTLLDQLVTDRLPLAAERGLTLAYEPALDVPPALADAALLTQVISNLVTNALNYTPPGGMVKVLTALRPHTAQTWVTVTICDTGPGIAAKDLPHLFERFYRGEAGRRASAPGTGLGLAICQEIMTKLGGRLTVDSKPGQGAAFSVWLTPHSQ